MARAKKKVPTTFRYRVTVEIEATEELELTTLVGMAEEGADKMLEGCTEMKARSIGVEWAPLAPQIFIKQEHRATSRGT